MKKCIFTVLVNDYVNIYDKHFKSPCWNHFCITDDKTLVSNFWNIKVVNNPNTNKVEHVKFSRYWKTHLHDSLKDYDLFLYIDSRINIIQDVTFYANHIGNCDMVFMNHHSMDSIEQQFKVVSKHGYENNEMIQKIKKRYQEQNYNYDNGLIEGGIILFRNTPTVFDFLHDWWLEIKNYSHRDQLSANYVLWKHKNKLNYKVVENPIYCKNPIFKLLPRKHKRLQVNE